MVKRLPSFGRSELLEQFSHLAQLALWAPSLKEVVCLIPNSLCIFVSSSSAPYTAQHLRMSPLELGCTPSSHLALAWTPQNRLSST